MYFTHEFSKEYIRGDKHDMRDICDIFYQYTYYTCSSLFKTNTK